MKRFGKKEFGAQKVLSMSGSDTKFHSSFFQTAWNIVPILGLCLGIGGLWGCSSQFLKPRDFLNSPRIIDSTQKFGHLLTETVQVPATASIFLANAAEGTTIEFLEQNQKDTAPANSPMIVLEGTIKGGETLDINAYGEARHEPFPSINFDPNGWEITIEAGPSETVDAFGGAIGALVGLFDNQKTPFVIGRHRMIQVPRGAKKLFLGVLDFPGASSNNQGLYVVRLDVIRR